MDGNQFYAAIGILKIISVFYKLCKNIISSFGALNELSRLDQILIYLRLGIGNCVFYISRKLYHVTSINFDENTR